MRRYCWLFASPLYWVLAVWLLLQVSPILAGGSGSTATLYWGGYRPTPTLSEYLKFFSPYYVAGGILTFSGYWCALWLTWRVRRARPGRFLITSSLSFLLMLLSARVSDFGTKAGLWFGLRIFFFGLLPLLFLLKILLLLSLTTGVLGLLMTHAQKQGS